MLNYQKCLPENHHMIELGRCYCFFLTLCICFYRDVAVELPFVLMHPKPTDLPVSRPPSGTSATNTLGKMYVRSVAQGRTATWPAHAVPFHFTLNVLNLRLGCRRPLTVIYDAYN